MMTLEQRVFGKFLIGDGCWEWIASRYRNGYGQLGRRAGEPQMAHRAVYELLVGPIPEGRVLDHLCKNKACVRPDHLEPVTQRENSRRGDKALTTHCSRGHELTDDNVIWEHDRDTPRRRCRICRLASARAARERRRAA